jgi:YrbI family 3-deoxy-D-manno-octulosonate 8-phosphate phosphatase
LQLRKAFVTRVVVVIPARGGSRGVILKNVRTVGGVPLVARAVVAARQARLVDDVIVSTDHDAIADAAFAAGATVVRRPEMIAGDTASSESAVLHVLADLQSHGTDPEVVVLLQCTSPFIDSASLDGAIERILSGSADCVFSAVENHSFLWRPEVNGVIGVNHDARQRQRRQERPVEWRETGAFYAMRTAGLREYGHRFFGRVDVQPVPPVHAIEIDTPEDLELARATAVHVDQQPSLAVSALVTDFDGVHTDDRVIVDQDGREAVRVSREDGMGIARLRKTGVPVLILSTERNPVVAMRGRKLGVTVLHGIDDKAAALAQWLTAEGLDPAEVAYVGNDVNDLGCFALVGWPVAVAQAHPQVLSRARLVLRRSGGDGAVREVCEAILRARQGQMIGGPGPHDDGRPRSTRNLQATT